MGGSFHGFCRHDGPALDIGRTFQPMPPGGKRKVARPQLFRVAHLILPAGVILALVARTHRAAIARFNISLISRRKLLPPQFADSWVVGSHVEDVLRTWARP